MCNFTRKSICSATHSGNKLLSVHFTYQRGAEFIMLNSPKVLGLPYLQPNY